MYSSRNKTILCDLDTLLGALAKRKNEVTNLVGVSNNAGAGDSGLGEFYASPWEKNSHSNEYVLIHQWLSC